MLPTLLLLLGMFVNPAKIETTGSATVPLAIERMSLNERYANSFVNDVFKDNILLTMSYMDGKVTSVKDISWDEVEKPFHYEFSLKPNERFAFHDTILSQYADNVVKTTNAHFNYNDGFKSDGYLTGDGVCHLASLIYWVAKDAGLTAYAPTNHNFANIPGVPAKYGVAIYARPDLKEGAEQNLYITNNKEKPVHFVFDYKDNVLTLSIREDN